MIAAIAFSAAAHRSRSRESCAAKDSARSIVRSTEARAHCPAVASRVFARLRYHVDRLIRSASHGRCAGRLGPIPCARRQRSLRRRVRSRGVIMNLCLKLLANVSAMYPTDASAPMSPPTRDLQAGREARPNFLRLVSQSACKSEIQSEASRQSGARLRKTKNTK